MPRPLPPVRPQPPEDRRATALENIATVLASIKDALIATHSDVVEKKLDHIHATLHALGRVLLHQIDEETNSLSAAIAEIAASLGPEKAAEIEKLHALAARLNQIAKVPETPVNPPSA